jgi:2'-5' RNA ligase
VAPHAGRPVRRVRLVAEESLHVTLCFLGSVHVGRIDAIGAAIREVPLPADAVVLRVGDVAWLPPRRPRVCAVAVDEVGGGDALGTLQAVLSERLVAGGWYAPERRRFLAHVTIARLREGPRRPPSLVTPSLQPFAAAAVTLYRSWPGSRYESLSRVSLPG